MEKILASVKVKHKEGQLRDENTLITTCRDGEISAITGPCKSSRAAKDIPNTTKVNAPSEFTGNNGKVTTKKSGGDGTVTSLDVSGCATNAEVEWIIDESNNKIHTRCGGEADSDKITGKVIGSIAVSSHLWLKFMFLACFNILLLQKQKNVIEIFLNYH